MITEAEQCAEKAGVSAWGKYKHSDAASLPFETGYFDACRSEQLFQHLPNPTKALDEMARVTKVNGWGVVLDTDWGSGGIDTREIDIERRLVRFMADHMYHNGYSGRQLYRLFKMQGLVYVFFEVYPIVVTNYAFGRQIWSLDELASEAIAMNVVTEAEVNKIQTEFEQADADGVFFGYAYLTIVAGQKAG
jgi:ubiquinone/menaquinone biosynthesis C-methylase UbiE